MLGIGGRFAGAKGMVAMPNIADLTPDQALAVLEAAGLRRGAQSSSETSNSALNNRTFNQSVPAGTLVDYETAINYSFYIFVAPPAPEAPPPPVLCGDWYPAVVETGFDCLPGGFSRPWTITENRRNYCVNGVPTGAFITDGQSRQKILADLSQQIIRPTSVTGCPTFCQNTYSFTHYDGGCNYVIRDCNGNPIGNRRVTSCDSPGTDSSGATIPGCSQNCGPAPTPAPVINYWSTGCCGSSQVTGTSTISAQAAVNSRNSSCGSSVSSQQSGTGTSVPTLNCAPPVVCTENFVSDWDGDCINGSQLTAVRYRNSCTGVETVITSSRTCSSCISEQIFVSDWAGSCINGRQLTAVRYRDSCTGVETVVNGSQTCGGGGRGGGGGGLIAV